MCAKALLEEKTGCSRKLTAASAATTGAYLARKPTRPNVRDYIKNIFAEFYDLHGDRLMRDDPPP